VNCSIELKNLSFAYDKRLILKDISLTMGEGLTCVLAPNGEGKTTLLRCIAGYLAPDAGQVLIAGRDVRRLRAKELSRLMAIVPQQAAFDFGFTVEEFVMMGRHPHLGRFSQPSESDWTLVRQALRDTGLEDLAKRLVTQTSGGEGQRMMIARTLVQQARIMLLDEPVSSLDVRHQLDIMELIRTLVRRDGLTAVCVLHDFNLAARYADNIVILKEGRVFSRGNVAETLTRETIRNVYGVQVDIYNLNAQPVIVPV
jgi:iron complex transport system ATP-binding protein